MSKILNNYLEVVRKALGKSLRDKVSEPYAPTGIWFIDFSIDGYELLVQYSDDWGFGLSANSSDFGNAADEKLRSVEEAVHRTILLLSSKAQTIPSKTLSGLRGSETQSEVAHAMEIKQPSYAKMESKPLATFKVETLEKAVGALHGTLHLVVERAGRYYILQDPTARIDDAVSIHKLPIGLVSIGCAKYKFYDANCSIAGAITNTLIEGNFGKSNHSVGSTSHGGLETKRRSTKKLENWARK